MDIKILKIKKGRNNWKLERPEFIAVMSSASDKSLFIVNEVAANAAKGTTINNTEGRMYIITWAKITAGWLYSIIYSKLGKDLTTEEGKIIKNESLTLDPHPVKTYAFCSDTSYNESIVPLIKFVDLLYHESTFLEKQNDWNQRYLF